MTSINWDEWGLPAPLTLKSVPGGLINRSFRAEFADGPPKFLQGLNRQVFTNWGAIEQNMNLIFGHPVRELCVLPIRRKDGRIHNVDGWRVFEFLPDSKDSTRPTLEEMGKFWGKFTACLQEQSLQWETVIPNFHSAKWRWMEWEQKLHPVPDEFKDLALNLETMSTTFLDLEKRLPLAVQHHDAKLPNLLCGPSGMRAVDLDTLQPGYLGSDFGDLVRSAAARRHEDDPEPNSANSESFEALWRGYAAGYPDALSISHLIRLMPAYLSWMQALRFATDACNGSIYYRVDYPGQNWVRAKNQIELAKDLLRLA